MSKEQNRESSVSENVYIAHISLIQSIISRMADNSHNTKKFCITLISLLMTAVVSVKTSMVSAIAYLLIAIVIAFWLLDGFYLYLESDFRKVHVEIAHNRKINFDVCRDKSGVKGYVKSIFSPSVLLIYPIMIVSIIVVALVTKAN